MNINDLIEHLEGVRRDWGSEVDVKIEHRPWLMNDWEGTDTFDVDVSDDDKSSIVLVWGEGYGFSTECGGDIDMCPQGGCEVCDV